MNEMFLHYIYMSTTLRNLFLVNKGCDRPRLRHHAAWMPEPARIFPSFICSFLNKPVSDFTLPGREYQEKRGRKCSGKQRKGKETLIDSRLPPHCSWIRQRGASAWRHQKRPSRRLYERGRQTVTSTKYQLERLVGETAWSRVYVF